MQLLESILLLLLLLVPFQLGPVHVQRDDAPQDVPGLECRRRRRLQPELCPAWSSQLVVRIEVGIAATVTTRTVVVGQVVGGTPPGLILNGRLVVGLVDPAEAPRVRVRCEKRQCIKVGDQLKTTR